ncbi:MAG: phosphopyruvate hydratase, partial [Candidatus Micrarchaeia archaeon]
SLGGNVAVAASMAYAKLTAAIEDKMLYEVLATKNNITPKLPNPMGNVIGGGKHAVNGTTMQEFLALSTGKSYSEMAFANIAVHKKIGEILKAKFPTLSLGLGDEKAWVASLDDDYALQVLSDATKYCSEKTGVTIRPAIDLAATEFYEN